MPFILDLPPNTDIPKTSIELSEASNISESLSRNLPENFVHLDQDLIEDVYITNKFETLVETWNKNTMFSSSIYDTLEDKNFQEILKMGKRAIPLIIDSISKEPSQLVWALNLILEKRIKSKKRLTITDACEIWVKLYNQGKLI